MEERQAIWSQDVALSAMRSGFREFAREIVTHIGGEVKQLRDNVGKFCEGAIEGAKAIAAVEGEARPREEPVKLKFPDAYGGKKEENFDNWEASVNSYIYLQHILSEEQVFVAFQALKDEAASFARSLAHAAGCKNNLVAYSKVTPISQFFKLLKERFADPMRGVRTSDKLQTIHSRQWRSARALKGTMDDLVAVPDHGITETRLVQLFYRAMPEALRGHFFDKSQQAGITYDALSREVVLYESRSMPVTTFWHKDLDKGKRWKGRTISDQVRAKDHMILTLEEGGTDEVPYNQIEWGLEEEDSSVGQGRSYAAVAAGGRPPIRGGGQGQRGQAMGGRGPGAQGVGGQGNRQVGGRGQGLPPNRQGNRSHCDEVEGHLKEDGTQACHRAGPGKIWAWTSTYGKSAWTREHQGHLRQVLEKLREANFKINPKKCERAKTQVLYLGHVLDGDGIKPEDGKIATIRDWSTPRTLTELRSFLGLANYYRKFVRNFSTIAAPLRRLLKKEAIWQWDKDYTSALKRLKRALIEYPVLKGADPSLPFVVTSDAMAAWVGSMWQKAGQQAAAAAVVGQRGRVSDDFRQENQRGSQENSAGGKKVVGAVKSDKETAVLTFEDVWSALWEGRQEANGGQTEVIPDFNSDNSGPQKPEQKELDNTTEKRPRRNAALAEPPSAAQGQRRVHFAPDEEAVRDYLNAEDAPEERRESKALPKVVDPVREVTTRGLAGVTARTLPHSTSLSESTSDMSSTTFSGSDNSCVRIERGMDDWFRGKNGTSQIAQRSARKTALKAQEVYTLPDGSGASQVMTKYMMPALDLERALGMQRVLVEGAVFVKVCSKGKRTLRDVWISESLDLIYWAKMKWWRVRSIPVQSVSKVSCGRVLKYPKSADPDVLLTLTISSGKTLDLEVRNFRSS
ncbi:hypothetical protein CBR_g22955 [Chara braunii]|uniref:Reverse transcriptase/retrotransposon-derived protein RNase H-like domain-containing protein n=1 Tax=Chara braunii TaxID=69332 RepID=A0A388L361_CHABU|nr:hypothetical protein CBR_g22955 [Chara braunii]|eukprot:GBG76737.1 hypothetical protein CBR_g22955 [Chara braunii]